MHVYFWCRSQRSFWRIAITSNSRLTKTRPRADWIGGYSRSRKILHVQAALRARLVPWIMKTKRKTVPSKAKRKVTPGRRAAKDIAQFAPNSTVYVLSPDQVCLASEDRKFFM